MAFIVMPALSWLRKSSEISPKQGLLEGLSSLYREVIQNKNASFIDLINDLKKINELLNVAKSKDKQIFQAVFGDIQIDRKNLPSEKLKQKIKDIFNAVFEKISKEKELKNYKPISDEEVKNGFENFKKDFKRTGDATKLGSINIDNNSLEYVLVENKKNKKDFLDSLDKKLINFLNNDNVNIDDEDKERFKNLIYFLFNQFSVQQFISTPVLYELNQVDSDKDFLNQMTFLAITGLRREDFSEKITIVDSKTISIQLKSKDKNKEFKVDKFYAIQPDEKDLHGVKINNVRSNFIFALDHKKNWKVKENKTLFTVSDIY